MAQNEAWQGLKFPSSWLSPVPVAKHTAGLAAECSVLGCAGLQGCSGWELLPSPPVCHRKDEVLEVGASLERLS